jgi:hypothetical protein
MHPGWCISYSKPEREVVVRACVADRFRRNRLPAIRGGGGAKGKTLLRTHECKELHTWAEGFAGRLAGVQGMQDQAGGFYGVVDRGYHFRGVLDRLAAEADRRGESRGD